MATRAAPAPKRSAPGTPAWLVRARATLAVVLRQAARVAAGGALAFLGLALALALVSYSPADPSFNTATARVAGNAMGDIGAHVADLLLQLAGWPMLMLVPALMLAGWRVARAEPVPVARMAGGSLAGAAVLSLAAGGSGLSDLGAPAGAGGLLGQTLSGIAASAEAIPELADVSIGLVLAILLAPVGLALLAWGSAISRDAVTDAFAAANGLMTPEEDEAEPGSLPLPKPARPRAAAAEAPQAPEPGPVVVVERPERPGRSDRAVRDKQKSLDLGDAAVLPGLDLLAPPPSTPRARIDAAALEQNARLLEGVLEDFGVRGRIGEVRPGPVVTMYELEPAPGIKASRVIGLADDIARSMSALSARVAVVPGKNVIGIELPNQVRETVSLSELLGSADFDSRSVTLPLVLGKDIAGAPVVADLAPMPHLLIAGTTGSGKSVGLNAMILSLLYKMTPAQCRLIMIDPKMLELKMYDGIPHLLAPVVVDPPKAVRALKWAVEEMERRYRMMSAIGARNLTGFNERVRTAIAKGKPLGRRIQIGFDPDTGEELFEEHQLDYQVIPQIVVIVDELADLMVTVGKEIEVLIQRLSQKSRAAGIHLIMATQRPSVDVITGVIKANLPTRISFAVTSRIDSRTILGEQGAEQLLGKGDMLYKPNTDPIRRVHGPFVSDEEVEAIAD
ncbi:MAG: hypothetical protein RIS17_1827, partial [Pseudomonadota bacterium]